MRIPAPTLHALYDQLARAHGADDDEARRSSPTASSTPTCVHTRRRVWAS